MRSNIYLAFIPILFACTNAVEILRAQSYGRFASPNFPRPYGDNLEKEWRIEVKKGYRIKIRFSSFDLEDSYEPEQGPCIYDYVVITEDEKEIGRFCGNKQYYPMDAPGPQEWFYTDGNTATVRFVSDYSNEDITPTGFEAHYVELDIDECQIMKEKEMYTMEDWDELVTCNHFCNNIPGGYYCSCRAGFTLHSNKHTCIATFCENQRYTADQGMIETPEYPKPYGKWSNCQWNINVRKGMSVNLAFDHQFEIEEHDDEGCAYDILKLIYNDNEDVFCGSTVPGRGAVMDMNTRDVMIQFKSDFSVEKMGFRVTYNTTRIRCLKLLSAPTNGRIIRDFSKGYHAFEDVVNFECNSGYNLTGQSRLECLDDGSWDYEQPVCEIKKCGFPKHLDSLKYSHLIVPSGTNFTYLDAVTVECDDWYEIHAGYTRWVCKDSGYWETFALGQWTHNNDHLPKCRPRCGERAFTDDATGLQLSGAKKVTKYGGWPWMAFIDKKEDDLGRNTEKFCGGALVDEMTVVTAAHCLDKLEDVEIDIWLGLRDRKIDEFSYVQKFTATADEEHIIYHNSFNDLNKEYYYDGDIGVIKLDRPANLSKYVHPICLPTTRQDKQLPYSEENRKAIVTGWGKTEHQNFTDILHKVRVGIQNHDTCKERYTATFTSKSLGISDNMLCAGFDNKINDACKGDSGGPLVIRNENTNKWYLSGIVSYGDERHSTSCGKPKIYGAYTDVGKYTDWISNYMED